MEQGAARVRVGSRESQSQYAGRARIRAGGEVVYGQVAGKFVGPVPSSLSAGCRTGRGLEEL